MKRNPRLPPKRRDTKWYRAAIERLADIGHRHTEHDQGTYCCDCPYGEPAPELMVDEDSEREDQPCDCCQLCVEVSCCGSHPEYNCPGDCYARGKEGHYGVRTDGGNSEFPERLGAP
jgi:hypothetical protein